MAMASAPFIPRRPPPSLQFLSRRPPARQYCFLGLLQPHRHYSSSSCQYPPQVAPSTAGACEGGDAEQGEKAANAQEKGAAASAAARRMPAAPKGRLGAPRGGGGGTTTKPKRKGPTPPGNPIEGTGGSGGVIHAGPDAAPSSSSSS